MSERTFHENRCIGGQWYHVSTCIKPTGTEIKFEQCSEAWKCVYCTKFSENVSQHEGVVVKQFLVTPETGELPVLTDEDLEEMLKN
ncbi:unnamed protein product [Soboliphyme baturini]|uniref:Cold-shock protein n=1 Tax=Soboliphyme baturini TaxID=241478 RepID=A0A183IFZ2_9BILA|nr:unnamed protein product [Soboliphyme baturini]